MTTPAEPTPSDPTPVRPPRPTRPSASRRGRARIATAGQERHAGRCTTLTGTVSSGVEPGCLLLDGYLLLGGPRDVLKPGARVTVTGQAEPGMMTTCQQGTPFVVESAKRS